MRLKEQTYLSEKVNWYDSIKDIGNIEGCIISNELIDNFSVHPVVMEDELMEVFVGYDQEFIELLQPATAALKNYLSELGIELPAGYKAEINLEAILWIQDIATFLESGYVITIDYGSDSAGLYKQYRENGTIVCYNKHHVNDCPYKNIGEQDITSHVNFSALYHWGLKNGLALSGFTDQAHFLLSLGINDHLKNVGDNINGENIIKKCRENALLRHILLLEMGHKYKVLIQQKGLPVHKLKGLELFTEQIDANKTIATLY